jgi:hypothetical protein
MIRVWRLDFILSGEQGFRLNRGTTRLGPLANAGRGRHVSLSGAGSGDAVDSHSTRKHLLRQQTNLSSLLDDRLVRLIGLRSQFRFMDK